MGKIKRYRNSVERFLSGEKGQRFFNFAYSIGAAIVIWGALYKILHIRGGDLLLAIGMGTEVLMFILTAFDRPPREYRWDLVYPQLDDDTAVSHDSKSHVSAIPSPDSVHYAANVSESSGTVSHSSTVGGCDATMSSLAGELDRLRATTEALNRASQILLDSYSAITENSDTIVAGSTGYVEQMQALNRNISGLNTIYEIQLKSVSSQLDAIDNVNRGIKDLRDMYEKASASSINYCRESEKMAVYMQQLNAVYENMLAAMTVNMNLPRPDGTRQQ